MPKSYKNEFKIFKFGDNRLFSGSSGEPQSNFLGIPIDVEDLSVGLNPIKQIGQLIGDRGTEKGKDTGEKLEQIGQVASTIGLATEDPLLSGIGTGLSVIGGYEKGETTGEILGGAIGSVIGGRLGGEFGKTGQLLGGALGGNIGSGALKAIEEMADGTHNTEIKRQIAERSHLSDKYDHHQNVSLPSDLKAPGDNKANVGETLQREHNIANKIDMELEILEDNPTDVLSYLMDNFSVIEKLGDVERNMILDEILDSNVLADILS